MKNILITGCNKGLGLNILKRLLKDNEFIIYAVNRSETEEFAFLKKTNHERIFSLNFDLANINEIKDNIFKKFINLNVPIYGVINNAAIAYDDIVTNLDLNQLKKMFDINVYAPMIITKYAIRNMLFHQIKGSIINISSISVHTGYKGLSMYAATKGALEAFSKNIAREWGTKGIRSNCIVAGFMETNMTSTLTEELKDRIYQRTALKMPTNPEDVANLIAYLLSDNSFSITGQNIFIDSGTI